MLYVLVYLHNNIIIVARIHGYQGIILSIL